MTYRDLFVLIENIKLNIGNQETKGQKKLFKIYEKLKPSIDEFQAKIDDGKPKYGSPTGQKAHLYNVSDITLMSPYILVCEGELDTIIASGVLGIPAVGVPGVQAWKSHYPKLFGGYETVFVVGDNDIKEDGTNPGAEFPIYVPCQNNKKLLATQFAAVIDKLPDMLNNVDENKMKFQQQYYRQFYHWNVIKTYWENFLNGI